MTAKAPAGAAACLAGTLRPPVSAGKLRVPTGRRDASTVGPPDTLTALESHARANLWTLVATVVDTIRLRCSPADFTDLVHHNDRGSQGEFQYTPIRFGQALAEADIAGSVGTTGDSSDNALAESINGLYKSELIKPRKPWKTLDEVETATAEWAEWCNHRRSTSTAATSRRPNSRRRTPLATRPGSLLS